MNVFKFGGASLKDSKGVKNVASIIASQASKNLLVVVSAMGKTTDMLERVLTLASSKKDYRFALEALKKYHYEIIGDLFQNPSSVINEVDVHFNEIDTEVRSTAAFDQTYDQVVSKGELVSSIILHHYLVSKDILSVWHDSRNSVCTDDNFREGRVDWGRTSVAISSLRQTLQNNIIITQGFIG
ncbi:MAG TPA: aspartate kinase, partial [Chryseolinea sp.]|nr:aspartate kinase [Chryseolinea sp.]